MQTLAPGLEEKLFCHQLIREDQLSQAPVGTAFYVAACVSPNGEVPRDWDSHNEFFQGESWGYQDEEFVSVTYSVDELHPGCKIAGADVFFPDYLLTPNTHRVLMREIEPVLTHLRAMRQL